MGQFFGGRALYHIVRSYKSALIPDLPGTCLNFWEGITDLRPDKRTDFLNIWERVINMFFVNSLREYAMPNLAVSCRALPFWPAMPCSADQMCGTLCSRKDQKWNFWQVTDDWENRWLLFELLSVDWDSPYQEQACVDREKNSATSVNREKYWLLNVDQVNRPLLI